MPQSIINFTGLISIENRLSLPFLDKKKKMIRIKVTKRKPLGHASWIISNGGVVNRLKNRYISFTKGKPMYFRV